MRRLAFSFCALLLATTPVAAKNVQQPPGFFKCVRGDCVNGYGVVWDVVFSYNMAGRFANGQTIAGETYVITLPIAPGKSFRQIYGADGLLQSGDNPRSIGISNGVVPFFQGTYGRVEHSFLRVPVAFLAEGSYDSGIGIIYRGKFRFMPSKGGASSGLGSGYYIFFGDKIDSEEGTSERGLYISDEAFPGAPVRFVKADPSFLALLQQKYQRDLSLAQVEWDAQQSRQRWSSVFAIIGKIAFAYAGGNTSFTSGNPLSLLQGGLGSGSGGGVGGDIALNLVSTLLNGKDHGSITEVASQVIGAAIGDHGTSQQITKILLDGVENGPAATSH